MEMIQKSLDDVLTNTQSMIRLTGDIEADDEVAGISVAQIFGEIDALAKTMNSELPMISVAVPKKTVDYRDAKKLLGILRKLDEKASKFAFYRRLRPALQRRFVYLKTVRYADGKELLALNNSGLIIALYQTVLGREPEQSAIDNGLLFLTGAGVHKLDLIEAILATNEAKGRGVRLKGLTVRRMLLKIRRAIFKTPYVDVRTILEYHNVDFVAVLYRTVLRREPDPEAIESGVKYLSKFGNHKIDLITSVASSEEAKRYNVKIKGLTIRKFLLKCKRKIYRTPLLGYIARWFANVAMLPRRINYLVSHIENLQSDNEVLRTNASLLEDKIYALNWYISDQNEKQQEMVGEIKRLNVVCGQLINACTELNTGYDQLSNNCVQVTKQYEDISSQIATLRSLHEDAFEKVEENLQNMGERISRFAYQTDCLSSELSKITSRMNTEKEKKEQLEQENKAFFDKLYVNYNEKLLPDTRENVKQGVHLYLDKLNSIFSLSERSNINIVDLGCGECEWVELLRENQYDAIGIDSNSRVVKKVMETLPLIPIVENNALDYLKGCADNSIDVLTSFHMVEHMDLLELMELLKECHRVMKKDGILLVETPNPQNILTATYYFYLDPTHKKPIPNELLAFLVQEAGFGKTETVFRNPLNFEPYEYKEDDPIKDIVFRFNLEQAYAIWAVK